MSTLRIGVDFDNTISDYNHVFAEVARREGMLPDDFVGDKLAVRATLRAMEDGERIWQRLQGRVYGAFMDQARLIEGVAEFFARAREVGDRVFIVSHKSEFGHFDPDRVNLRDAARSWMENNQFFSTDGLGLSKDDVFFETTREAKIARIESLNLSLFIDDLPEVLGHPDFPVGVERWLYAPHDGAPSGPYRPFHHWSEMHAAAFESEPQADGEAVVGIAKSLVPDEVGELSPVCAGGNNRLFRVETADNTYALKF